MWAGLGVLPTAPIPWPRPLAATQHIQCFIDQKQQKKIQQRPCACAPGQAGTARPGCAAVPHLGGAAAWTGGGWHGEEGTVQGRLLAWGRPLGTLESPPCLD